MKLQGKTCQYQDNISSIRNDIGSLYYESPFIKPQNQQQTQFLVFNK